MLQPPEPGDLQEPAPPQELLDPVEHFETSEQGYFAYSRGGRTVIIMRAQPIQPPIGDADDYLTLLWVHALDGYYALAQQIVAGTPRRWYLVRRWEASWGLDFFHEFADGWEHHLDVAALHGALDEAWRQEGGARAR
jgi:hypothetical protein